MYGKLVMSSCLTAEDYQRLREKLDSLTVEKPDAETTKRNLAAVYDKWKR